MQFFPSKKKKKFVSPLSKSGRVEPDSKRTVEGSPSAKGSLSSYLVSSQNEDRLLSSVPTACGPSDNQDQVRRNLTSAIESSDSVHGVENPELQQFANSFLSFYCRYVSYFCCSHIP